MPHSRLSALLICLIALTACGEGSYNDIDLMPSPTLFAEGAVDPFNHHDAALLQQHTTLFYATDRRPATAEDPQPYYANARGIALRTGEVRVQMTPPAEDWDSLRAITIGTNRDTKRSLRVTNAIEYGPLPFSSSTETGQPLPAATTKAAARQFSSQINRQLRISGNRDVFVYVHGYNVDFEYPSLVAKELQHFLGYRGAFISYNWPATPSRLAYLRDLETASATRRNLRELVEFLSTETDARRIHLIGYSAGSRLVFEVAYQIALQQQAAGRSAARLGQVILIGSDLDRTYFTQSLEDGLLDGMDHLSIYMSSSDAALNLSRIVFGRNRLGQVATDTVTPTAIVEQLRAETRLSLIDASDAKGADLGNGHWYFRSSPWASSDILLSLMRGQTPDRRGLVRAADSALWQFPEDYPVRLKQLAQP